MPRERRRHAVVADDPALLDALAAPFGTYVEVAVCRAVPSARRIEDLAVDLACAVGRTEALTRRARLPLDLVELWLRSCRLRSLFVTGADALGADLWQELCALGRRTGAEVVFVSAEPTRQTAAHGGMLAVHYDTYLRVDPERVPVQPPIGVPLPAMAFPALPAACQALLEPAHAERALAIYDECLVAAYDALPHDRLLERDNADYALRAALARAPDLAAAPLAFHALRAAGILRGHDVRVVDDRPGHSGVAIDALLTADRLDQLCGLLGPELAMAGVLAGLPDGWSRPRVDGDGLYLWLEQAHHRVADRLGAIVRAWSDGVGVGSPARRRMPPPRRPDARWRQLWRTPPPDRVYVTCEPIKCESLRFIAPPRMDWARPTREEANAERTRFRPC